MTRSVRAWLFLAPFLMCLAMPAAAQFPRAIPNGFTWGELALLPEYCKDTQGTVWDTRGNGGPMAPNTDRWVAAMGEDFFHVHHYCYGLRNMLRAEVVGERSTEGLRLLQRALGEFGYMFRAANSSMPLMPEIYLKEGEVHLKLGNTAAAGVSFERSRTLRPDYWPAYTRWADVLVSLKLNERARELLREGLRHSPGQPELVQRLKALGAAGPTVAAADAALPPASASASAPSEAR